MFQWISMAEGCCKLISQLDEVPRSALGFLSEPSGVHGWNKQSLFAEHAEESALLFVWKKKLKQIHLQTSTNELQSQSQKERRCQCTKRVYENRIQKHLLKKPTTLLQYFMRAGVNEGSILLNWIKIYPLYNIWLHLTCEKHLAIPLRVCRSYSRRTGSETWVGVVPLQHSSSRSWCHRWQQSHQDLTDQLSL